ncbi:hypothetical protein HER32_00305 [Hymenobacter sp. BT18]|uniref:hypothetical protein n=1 Tax=Hymenobacter sp. BT18 TaxID=2835648 RepID=UPI00143E5E41|nr:hypothetical protein [Hymenobacter sp. BT18]QIX59717.1 hypothetical protein HER32_00305 [Hymenobacter sp. BT18]
MRFIPDDATGGGPVAASQVSVTNAGYDNQQEVNDALLYVALAITSFSHAHGVRLLGSTLASVTLSWAYNKAVTSQAVAGQLPAVAVRSLTLAENLTANKTYTLQATDGETLKTANATVYFSNDRFWGVGPAGLNGPGGLSGGGNDRPATETRVKDFTVTAGPGQKIYYMRAARLGVGTYKVGGFEGGFVERLVSYTNSAGHIENFLIGESATDNLGVTTVNVS